jgi:hypothetical protein
MVERPWVCIRVSVGNSISSKMGPTNTNIIGTVGGGESFLRV